MNINKITEELQDWLQNDIDKGAMLIVAQQEGEIIRLKGITAGTPMMMANMILNRMREVPEFATSVMLAVVQYEREVNKSETDLQS